MATQWRKCSGVNLYASCSAWPAASAEDTASQQLSSPFSPHQTYSSSSNWCRSGGGRKKSFPVGLLISYSQSAQSPYKSCF